MTAILPVFKANRQTSGQFCEKICKISGSAVFFATQFRIKIHRISF
ncbi:hypothetical protein [Frederiksenia canicola]|nr:hypothetical protein [Frederiksenia canicola]